MLHQVPRQPMVHFRLIQHVAVVIAGQVGHDLRREAAECLGVFRRVERQTTQGHGDRVGRLEHPVFAGKAHPVIRRNLRRIGPVQAFCVPGVRSQQVRHGTAVAVIAQGISRIPRPQRPIEEGQ